MFRRTILAIAIAPLCAGAFAAVSVDEAKQLGTTLTAVGAEKGANKDGTIPAAEQSLKHATFPVSYPLRPCCSLSP